MIDKDNNEIMPFFPDRPLRKAGAIGFSGMFSGIPSFVLRACSPTMGLRAFASW